MVSTSSEIQKNIEKNSIVVVFRPYRGTRGFFLRLVTLVGKQPQFGALRALSLLAADLGDPLLFRSMDAS